MLTRPSILCAFFVLAACHATDPCNGVAGSCIALRVDGPSSARVDRLDITIAGATQSSTSKSTGLPVQLAIVPPSGTTGDIELDVAGFLVGAPVGTGSTSANVVAGGHTTASVTLAGGDLGDMGGDMAMTSFDLSGGCVPSSTVCSNGSTLQTCGSDGMTLTPTNCALGCAATPTPHCEAFVPSAPAMTSDLQTGLADTVMTTGVTYLVNTDDGSITNLRAAGGGTLSQITYRATTPGTNDPGAGVFSFNSLDIQEGATLQAIGGRALIIVADTTIKVNGVIDGRAYDKNSAGTKLCNLAGVPGAGGFAGATTASGKGAGPGGGGGGTSVGGSNGGGGGGAHGGIGGQGGYTVSGDTNYGTGGVVDFPAAPLPLRGGSGGGAGPSSSMLGTGGGGGGAVQLVAATSISIGGGATNSGGIDVGACGGGYGIMFGGGGGGGAGGMILIESPAVNVLAKAVLAANGGGGGSYSMFGAAGDLSANAAAGSPGSNGYTTGGQGSNASIIPGSSGGFNSTYNGGGGGGGGAGLILINNVSGSLTPASGAIVSPTLNAKNGANQTVSAVGAITVQ